LQVLLHQSTVVVLDHAAELLHELLLVILEGVRVLLLLVVELLRDLLGVELLLHLLKLLKISISV
jgi:hypothetical protein